MNPFLMVLLGIFAVLGVLFTLETTGKTNLGLKRLWGEKEVVASNLTPVILSAMLLEPGQQVGLGHVLNVQRNGLNTKMMNRDFVSDRRYLARFEEVKGRVLARRKPANEAFIEADFLPKKSPSGLIGLVPKGMRLVMLPAASAKGIEALQFGNHFDLHFSAEADDEIAKVAKSALEDREFISDEDRIRLSGIARPTRQHLIAQGGVVLRPSAGGRDAEVAVALHPDDVSPTLTALESGGSVYCIARPIAEGEILGREDVAVVDPIEEYRWLFDSRQEVEIYKGNEKSVKSVKKAERE